MCGAYDSTFYNTILLKNDFIWWLVEEICVDGDKDASIQLGLICTQITGNARSNI